MLRQIPLGVTFVLMLGATAPAAPLKAKGGDPMRGRQVFETVGCWQCHGYVGQGGFSGPRIAPRPMPLPALAAYVRSPSGDMPPYSAKILSAKDIVDIYAYLASIAP